jgi:alpha-galactosidase
MSHNDSSLPCLPPPEERAALVRYRVGEESNTLRLEESGQMVSGHGLRATWRWQQDDDSTYRMWVRLTNRGRHTVYLDTVDVLTAPGPNLGVPPEAWSVYQHGWASWSPVFARHIERSLYAEPGTPAYRDAHQPHWEEACEGLIASEWVSVVAGRRAKGADGWAVLLGFVTAREQLGEIRIRSDGSEMTARCYFDGMALAPGEATSTETLLVRVGPDPLRLLEEWADELAANMAARVPPRPPTGWCSWYYFYGQNTAADVLANLSAMADHDLPLDVVLIDDGYQTAIGDWFSLNERFPDGMEALGQAIHQAGRRFGLWTAPFGAAADSQLFAAHPDWVLRDERGEPVVGWVHWLTRCYALDCTHPQVQEWLRETFGRMRREWGVDFFKIDFIFAAARPGVRHDPASTRAQALRRGVEAIRQGIGDDAFLLGCGAPQAPCVGLVDGMRVGPDVDPHWLPMWRHDLSMPSAENALRNSIARAPFHGRLWANDPDCLLVRQRARDMDLVLNEMRTSTALTALLGGLTLDSDHLPQMRPGRLKYLRQALPPTGVSARPLDLFENELPQRLLLPVEREWGRWWVVGLVNWGERTVETAVPLAELGLPPGRYHAYHYWRRRYLGVVDEQLTIRRHQPHETAVVLLRPVVEKPDLLTTTFHVCQGAVEMADLQRAEEGSRLRLTAVLEKAGRQFGELLFTVPPAWRAVEARVDGMRHPLVAAPGVVRVGLTLEGRATVEVDFERGE